MNTNIRNALSLTGRLLLAALFIPAGLGKITGFEGTVGYIASAGLPLPALGAAAAIAVEVGGGLALLLGIGTRAAAFALALFTLAASFFFHAYWGMPADQQFVQHLLFFKNVAVTGGLLVLAAEGSGGWSVEGWRGSGWPAGQPQPGWSR